MESQGYFVATAERTSHLAVSRESDECACPVCESRAVAPSNRPYRLKRLFTTKQPYWCRQCKTNFWAAV